jgi:hypothetical protein
MKIPFTNLCDAATTYFSEINRGAPIRWTL